MANVTSNVSRRVWIEAVVALILIGLGFAAIAASDVSAGGSHRYWIGLVVIYGLAALVIDWSRMGLHGATVSGLIGIALHWAAVLVAIQAVYLFVSSGRMANADTGLTSGLILALGMFTAGSPANWRPLVIGAALGAATAAVAMVEQYLWVMVGLALLAVAVVVLGTKMGLGHRPATDA